MLLKSVLLATATVVALPVHETPVELAIGAALPAAEVKMKDVMGGERSLKEVAGKNGLLVVFSCNTCPFVVGSEGSAGWEGRYPAIGNLCREQNVGFALVNSNAAKRGDVDEVIAIGEP